jgi:hypothetical protein
MYYGDNYCDSGLCPSSGIHNTRKNVSETGSVSVLGQEGKTPTLLGPLKRSNFNHWMETDLVSETLCFLAFIIPDVDKVHKPINSECYTPSSEPFRLYMCWGVSRQRTRLSHRGVPPCGWVHSKICAVGIKLPYSDVTELGPPHPAQQATACSGREKGASTGQFGMYNYTPSNFIISRDHLKL